jgi:hypothetical protein
MADVLFGSAFLAWIASTVWVWFDAKPRDWSEYSLARTRRQWVLGFVLLWPYFAPFYLAARGKAPIRSALET